MARAPALFFRLELADAIVYRITTAFVDFNVDSIPRKLPIGNSTGYYTSYIEIVREI